MSNGYEETLKSLGFDLELEEDTPPIGYEPYSPDGYEETLNSLGFDLGPSLYERRDTEEMLSSYTEEDWLEASRRFAFIPSQEVETPITTEEKPDKMGTVSRLFNNIFEAAMPFPMNRNIPEATDAIDMWTDAIGTIIGVPVGMIPFAMVTGGYGTAVSGASKLSQLNKALNLAKTANKLAKAGKGAQAAKTMAEVQKITKAADLVGDVETMYKGGGILGATKAFAPYRRWVERFGAGETKFSASLAKMHDTLPSITARAADMGLKNLATFSMYGQAKVAYPWELKAEERLNALQADAVTAAVFSVAGLPTAGLNTFAKTAAAKWGVRGLEATTLFGAGMVGGDIGAWAWDQDSPTMEERLIHGGSLLAFHYARLGLSKVQVQERMRLALRGMGMDETTINKLEMGLMQTIPDGVFKFLQGNEGRKYRNVFKERNNEDNTVDLVSITKPRTEGGQYMVVYRDINKSVKGADGKLEAVKPEYHTIRDKTLEGAKKKFFGEYEKVRLDEAKAIKGKGIVKPKEETQAKVEEARSKAKGIKRAVNKKRTFDEEKDVTPIKVAGEDKTVKAQRVQEESDINNTKSKVAKKSDKVDGAYRTMEFGTGAMTAKKGPKWFIKKIKGGFQAGTMKKDGTIKWLKNQQYGKLKELTDALKERQRVQLKETPGEITKYKLDLTHTTEGKNNKGNLARSIFGEDKLTFSSRVAAKRFANKQWLNQKTLESNLTKSQDTKAIYDSKYKKYEALKRRAFKNERDMGLTREESEALRLEFDPSSGGNIGGMTAGSLNMYTKTLEGRKWLAGKIREPGKWADGTDYLLGANKNMPTGILNTLGRNWQKSKVWAGEMVLPFTTILSMTKSRAYSILGYKVEMHELERQVIAALGIQFRNETVKKHGISTKEFDKLSPYLDSKFKVHEDTALTKKLGKRKINAIKKDFKNFSDSMFASMVEAGVEIRIAAPSNKGVEANAKWSPLLAVYEKRKGKLYQIDLHPRYFEKRKQKFGKILFDLMKWQDQPLTRRQHKDMYVTNSNGDKVKVSKVKHYYTEGYLTRAISKEFKSHYITDNTIRYLAEHLVERDPKYLERFNEYWQEETLGRSVPKNEVNKIRGNIKKRLIGEAEADIKILNEYTKNQIPIGTVFARTADLPSVLLMEKIPVPKEYRENAWHLHDLQIIRAPLENLHKYKKGDVVKIGDKEHKVAKIVKVYENNLNSILDNYMTNVSQIIPTYRHFGRNGAKGDLAQTLLRQGTAQVKDGGEMSKWADKYITAKINGVERSTAAQILNPFTAVVSNTGLSSPFAGFKNLMLQGVQNTSTFGYIAFTEGWLRYLANDAINFATFGKFKDSTYKQLATKTGALQIGVHDMLKGVAWKFNPGLMRQTERLNRYTTVAIGDVVLKNGLQVLAFGKQAPRMSRLMISEQRASHIMRKLFGFSQPELNTLIKGVRNNGIENIHNVLSMMPERLRIRALQKAHLTTAGGPTLASMPAWMSKDWAKPLTLFYRTAYQVTNNVIGNVMRPLAVEGNPFPMMRYVAGAGLTGAALYESYHRVLGKDMVNQFQDLSDDLVQYFMRGEGLGLGSNMFDEYGGMFSGYYPAIARTAESIYIILTSIMEGTKGRNLGEALKIGVNEAAKKNLVVYNHTLQFLDSHEFKVPIFKDKVSAMRLKKRQKEIERKRMDFLKVYRKEEIDVDRNPVLSENSPYYTMIRTSFWSGDAYEKARAYYSALHFMINDDRASRLQLQFNERKSRNENKKTLDGLLAREKPIPDSWKKRDRRGETVDKLSMFLSKLTPEQAKEVRDMMNMYEYQEMEFKAALRKYAFAMEFK